MSLTNHPRFPFEANPDWHGLRDHRRCCHHHQTCNHSRTAPQFDGLGYANRTRHRQCSRTHSHGRHFGQVGPGVGAVPGPRRFSRVLDGRGPLDGGDARRSLILRSDGKYALAARDSMLTLCDSTDRGFASFDDGTVVGRTVMQSNTLIDPVLQQRRNGPVAPPIRAGRARPDDRNRDLSGRQPGEHDRAAQGEHKLDPEPGVRSQKLRTQCIQSFAFSPADAIYSN